MQVDLDKVFPIDAPAAAAWQFLQDIEGVASCMPGAAITEKTDDQHYKGTVKSKVGPATMVFNGDIEIKALHADKQELHLLGSGQDSKGSSSAAMDLTAWVVDVGAGKSELHGKANVTVNGKLASIGGRMLTQVADQILNQFGANFANHAILIGNQNAEATAAAQAQLAEQPKELNGLAFAWSVLVGFIRDLLGKKA